MFLLGQKKCVCYICMFIVLLLEATSLNGQCTRSTLAKASGSKLAAQLRSFTFLHKTENFEVFKSDGSAPLFVEERGRYAQKHIHGS